MKKISIVPIYPTLEKNKVFYLDNERDFIFEPMQKLKEYFEQKKISINTNDINKIEDSDVILLYRFDLKLILRLWLDSKLDKSIYIPMEPEVVEKIHSKKNIKKMSKIFSRILTWNDEIIDNKKIVKYHVPMPYQRETSKVDFKLKKLLVNISGFKNSKAKNELYSERIKTIQYYERNHLEDFDLFGMGWNKDKFISYKGSIANKIEILKKYKFSLCYENMKNIKGYITEKIFDCFYASTIPIYWGAGNINEYIPKECYIDRREFNSEDELYNYLKNMSENEYNERLNKIKEYLNSEEYKKFLPKEYAQNIDLVVSEVLSSKEKNSRLGSFIQIFYFFAINLLKKIKSMVNKILKYIGVNK